MFSIVLKLILLILGSIFMFQISLKTQDKLGFGIFASFASSVTQAPIFVEKRLESLVSERKWQQIIKITDEALVSDKNFPGSFKFWYYRALGYCSQFQIKLCEENFLEACIFSSIKYQPSIQRMRQFLNVLKGKNISSEQNTKKQLLYI